MEVPFANLSEPYDSFLSLRRLMPGFRLSALLILRIAAVPNIVVCFVHLYRQVKISKYSLLLLYRICLLGYFTIETADQAYTRLRRLEFLTSHV
jgi:cytochrome c oxidase subunit IV